MAEPSNGRELANINTQGVVVSFVHWSQSSAQLAFVSRKGDIYSIETTNADGSGRKTLCKYTGMQSPFESLLWLPEGRLLVVEKDGAVGHLIVYEAASGERNAYDVGPIGFGAGPLLSPDGTTLAWSDHCGYSGENDGIWTLDTESGSSQKISEACGVTDLAWSPDGSEIAYSAEYTTVDQTPEASGGLYVVDLTDRETRRITNPSGGRQPESGKDGFEGFGEPVEVGVQWLRAGGFLVQRDFSFGCDHCPGQELFLVSADGSEQEQIDQVESFDERGVLYQDDEGLWYASSDDGERRLLFEHEDGWSLAADMSPDGRWISVTRHNCGGCGEYP